VTKDKALKMNERIKELAEQAELNATLLFNKDKLNLFAELIVRECASLFPERHYYYSGLKTQQIIRQHFGVEE